MDVLLTLLKDEASKLLNLDPDKIEDAFGSNRRLVGYYECKEGFWYRFKSDNTYENGTEGNLPATIGAYVVVGDEIVVLTFSQIGLSSKSVEWYQIKLGPDGIKLRIPQTGVVSTLNKKIDDMGADKYTAKLFEELRSKLANAERSRQSYPQNAALEPAIKIGDDDVQSSLQNDEKENYISIYAKRIQTETSKENKMPESIPTDTPTAIPIDTDFHGKQITPKNQAYKPVSTS